VRMHGQSVRDHLYPGGRVWRDNAGEALPACVGT